MRVIAAAFVVALGGACALSRPSEEPPRAVARSDDERVAPPSAFASEASSSPPADRCVRPMAPEAPPAAPSGADPRCPPDDLRTPPHLPTLTLAIPDANAKVHVEIARTSSERARGLMFRRAMPEDHGMLFRMGERKVHDFWMRNTCISLDMLFVDDDGLIVGIYENVPTLTEDERGVGCESAWVLETNAGWSRRHGVAPGQRLVIPGEARR